jgi:hypothetical protein
VPASERVFTSARNLVERTPAFWTNFVQPKLENDFMGMYRFLASPYPHGPNPYIDAVERNIAEIKSHIEATRDQNK